MSCFCGPKRSSVRGPSMFLKNTTLLNVLSYFTISILMLIVLELERTNYETPGDGRGEACRCHRFLFSVRRVVHYYYYYVQFPLNIQQMYCLDTIFHVMSTKLLVSSLRHICRNIFSFFSVNEFFFSLNQD